jgi:hypothetical protein
MKNPKYTKERKAHKNCVSIKIETKVPSKWRFVDLETGDVWAWSEKLGAFTGAKDVWTVAAVCTEKMFGEVFGMTEFLYRHARKSRKGRN